MSTDFSQFTRIIGRGPTLSRPLTREEAGGAMGMVLNGLAPPVALGGFLLVLRQRGETAAELAGFVDAVRARMDVPEGAGRPDLDWPSYADKHRQQPWFVLAALLLAENEISVLMHGIAGETDGCAATRPALAALGIAPSPSLAAAASRIASTGFAYVGLESIAPETEALFHLKPVLGVRSVANTFTRDLNPLSAEASLVGIVHAHYRPLHQETMVLLGQSRGAVFKGVGGEAQRNPHKAVRVAMVSDGAADEEEWPAVLSDEAYRWREEALDPSRIAALWRGDLDHPAAEASVVATAAVALKTLGRVETQAAALDMAQHLWRSRRDRPAAATG